MHAWAGFSRDGRYRYTLGRRWSSCAGRVCFCLLNPSTADARLLDPTLTRCLGFARRWGFGCMDVVNAFALRSTDPAGLRKADDPIGPGNDRAIKRSASRADLVVAGWGVHASMGARHERVHAILTGVCVPHCLGLTRGGFPKHPLYLPYGLEPVPMRV